jgi:hypothetical protein
MHSVFTGLTAKRKGTKEPDRLSFDQQPSGGGFANWAASYSLPDGKNGLLQDGDGDGFSNAAEFAFGTNPAQPGNKPQLDQKSVSVNGQSFPAAQYVRNKGATGVAIQIRASNSVTFDSAAQVVEVTLAEDLGNGLERVTVRSVTSAPHTFFFEVTHADRGLFALLITLFLPQMHRWTRKSYCIQNSALF